MPIPCDTCHMPANCKHWNECRDSKFHDIDGNPKVHVMTNETIKIERKIDEALSFVRAEVLRAMTKHGPMHSPHEAFGVIFEEFNIEFAEEMKKNDHDAQRAEMIQVAAMAVRALCDVYAPKES